MKIKKYIEFMKESAKYDYGCVMVEFPVDNWNDITSMIDQNDVYEKDGKFGIQDNPHVTIKFGLHKEVTEDMIRTVFDLFNDEIHINIHGIGVFENPEFDVVKFNVDPDGALQFLHDKLSELPNTDEFPKYSPHITIAYVKKGTGKKYINPKYTHTIENVNKIVYSKPGSNDKVYFDI